VSQSLDTCSNVTLLPKKVAMWTWTYIWIVKTGCITGVLPGNKTIYKYKVWHLSTIEG